MNPAAALDYAHGCLGGASALLPSLLLLGQRGPSALELLRLGFAVLTLPLLFRALRDEAARTETRLGLITDVARRTLFALAGAFVLFQLTARIETPSTPNDPGRGFQFFSQGVLNFRLRHGKAQGLSLSEELVPQRRAGRKRSPRMRGRGGRPSGNPLADLREAADLVPDSVTMQRYYGVALAEHGDIPAARLRLDRAVSVLHRRAPERADAEAAVWKRLFGPELPRPAEIEHARAELDGFGLGWLGHVAALAAYQRLGSDAVPPELRTLVAAEANRYTANLLLGGIINLFLLFQFGLVSFGVGIALVASGVLQPAPHKAHPTSAPLMESFIMMFVSGMLGGLVLPRSRLGAPETQPGAWAAALILGDLLELLALVYLWWRLSRRGLGLSEIGLTRKNLGANVVIGIMAAVVLMPVSMLVSLGTDWVTRLFFPDAPPAYHPLGGMTAGTSSAELRWALWATAAIGAPIIEETFFRGALFGALRRRSPFWTALLGSSAFFAVLHPQLPLGFLPIALLGAGFACLYEWRQSLVPGMVAHAVNNTLAFVMMSLIFPIRG